MLFDVMPDGPVDRLWVKIACGAAAFVLLVVLLARQILSARRGGRP